ncbi:hypothetical protein Aperf_G00000079013 [Anoplocephala perfoliata]
MVSNLDDSDVEGDEDEPETTKHIESIDDRNNKAVEFDTLPSLFDSLSLAFVRTPVTSPRWSHFMGSGFQLKQKVRLNNIIWREYHMQYVKLLPPVVVKFEVPSAKPTNMDRQCLVMSGKFWNQHSKKLTYEYRRWRTFFINHLRPKSGSSTSNRPDKRRIDLDFALDFPSKIPLVDDKDAFNDVSTFSGTGSPRFLDDLMEEFDGNLDFFLDKPFPDPRDTSMLGNSDIMQPGLTQLQPNSENYRSDLITGLLQQPVMPTIMEDEYTSTAVYHNHNRRSVGPTYTSQYNHNRQVFSQGRPNGSLSCAPYQTFRAYPSEYGYSNKQFLGTSFQPSPVAPKSIRFVEPGAVKSSNGNPALLNALLQKPAVTVPTVSSIRGSSQCGFRERHHSNSSSVASASSPETATTASQSVPFKRQQSTSIGNALIVDLSRERINPSPPVSAGVYVEEMSAGFMDTSARPATSTCESFQQSRLPDINGSPMYGYQSPGIIHNRFSSAERLFPSMVRAPVSPSSAASGTIAAPVGTGQILQVQSTPFLMPKNLGNDQQKLTCPYRRSRSQYHPNPPPYRRPQLLPNAAITGTGSISSAPELYEVCSLPPPLKGAKEPLSDYEKLAGESDIHATSDDLEESAEQVEVLLDESNETNDETDFGSCLLTTCATDGEDAGPSGLVNDDEEEDEDIKSAFLITPQSTQSVKSSSTSSGGQIGSFRTFQPSGTTEQRRRMSMQSSLKLLQELIQQNQELRGLGGRKTSVVAGSGISQTSHGQHPQHQQKTSKAAILRDGAELIRSQRAIGDRLDAQISGLQAELDSLHESVNACCEKLPTSGAMSKQQVNSMKAAARAWYHNFVSQATEANWKFYIFSLIFTDVFETYCDKVCCSSSREVLRRSTISWLEDHCDLPQLRKLVTQAICSLSITTNALQQPNLLPQQAREAAARLAAIQSTPSAPSVVQPPMFSFTSSSPSVLPHFPNTSNSTTSSPTTMESNFALNSSIFSASASTSSVSSVSITSPSITPSVLMPTTPLTLSNASSTFIHRP